MGKVTRTRHTLDTHTHTHAHARARIHARARQGLILLVTTMPKETTCGHVVRALPWVCVALGVVLLVLGLLWRHITNDHEANAVLVITGIVLIALAFATSCVRDMSPVREDGRAPEGEKPITNMGSGDEFNKVPFLSL